MFVMTGLIIAWTVTGTKIPEAHKTELINYVLARANHEDGGWGLHIESDSSVFGTTTNYLNLRLLGMPADEPRVAKARATLHKLGGAQMGPHWAKFWLAVLGVAKWEIVNPIPPELWILPLWVPFHPWRWWIHMRMVYLASSFVYSQRWTMPHIPLIDELRQEMFTEPYETINWKGHRNSIAPMDNFHPKSWILNVLNWILVHIWFAFLRPDWIKKRAEDHVYDLICMEDSNTEYSDLAPVSAPMNTICRFIREGRSSHAVKQHIDRLQDYIWVKSEGMLVNGTNGLQIWDTAFIIKSVIETGQHTDPKWVPMLTRALEFLDEQQMRENVPDGSYRQRRKGGWAFSNNVQGYAVSDCISEALKAVIMLQHTPGYPTLLEDQRIFDAVDTLLTFQNTTGGCASYEPQRGSELLEWLNAAEVFGRIMVEYDYPECTTAVVTALSLFSKHWPDYRAEEIKMQKARMVRWVKSNQRPDGAWYGSWGICFTYATMFALECLESIGETYTTSTHSQRGCEFLISKQRADGGWSESFHGCETMEYTEHPLGSLVVQTAWALLALMYAEYPDQAPIEKGIRFLMGRQQDNGEWLEEAIEGVFNKSAMITYQNYKFTFPIMALGKWARLKEQGRAYAPQMEVANGNGAMREANGNGVTKRR